MAVGTADKLTLGKGDLKYYCYVAIGLVLMFGFGYLPAFGPVTHQGMQMIGIFLAMLLLWTTCGLAWPSILGLVAMSQIEGMNSTQVWLQSFGNPMVMQTVFIMAVISAVEIAGVNDHIVNWFMSRKAINGHPWTFTLIMFVAVWFVGIVTNGMVAYFLFWSLLITVCEKFGIQKGDKWASMMFVGIMVVATMTFVQWPFKGMSLILLGIYKNASGVEVPLLNWLAVTLPLIMAIIFGYWAMMKYIFRPDVSKLRSISTDDLMKKMQPITKLQMIFVMALVAFMVGFAAPSVLPKGTAMSIWFNQLGLCGIIALIFAVLCIIRVNGNNICTFEKVYHKIPWDMIFMTASIFALAGIMTADSTGIKALLSDVLTPILTGRSDMTFLLVVILGGLILTNVVNNVVLGTILVTIVVILSTTGVIGGNPLTIITLLIFAVNAAFILPSGSMQSALLHSHPWLTSKEVYLYATAACLLIAVVCIVLGVPLGNLFYKI